MNQSRAAVLEEFDDLFKALLAAVIRVRDAWGVVILQIFHEGPDFVTVLAFTVQSTDIGKIVLVHGQNQVKTLQILGLNLTSPPPVVRKLTCGGACGYLVGKKMSNWKQPPV